MTYDLSILKDLLQRIEKADGPDRNLDLAILKWARPAANGLIVIPRYTASIDAALALVGEVLPGWWWSLGFCHLTNDASIGPDYRSGIPKVKALCDVGRFDGGFDVARVGGNVPLALLEVMFRALIAQEEEKPEKAG